jgi:predicted metalloenzyme YecM
MLLSNYKQFLDRIMENLALLGIDASKLTIDHIGYQASSEKDFDEKKLELQKFGEIKHDVQVGERRVLVVKLTNPLPYKDQLITAIEVVSPKKDQEELPRWEHIEIVPQEGLETFMKKYPNVEWDKTNIDRDIFPMITLKLNENTRAKFPRRPVLEEVERIKTNKK